MMASAVTFVTVTDVNSAVFVLPLTDIVSVSLFVVTSRSAKTLVKSMTVSDASSLTPTSEIAAASVGLSFTADTVTVNVSVTVKPPLSVAVIVMSAVPFWSAAKSRVSTSLMIESAVTFVTAAELNKAAFVLPVTDSVKVSRFVGISTSVNALDKSIVVFPASSSTATSAMIMFTTGLSFTAVTVTVKVVSTVSSSPGFAVPPSSVTVTVMVAAPF